MKRKLEEIRPEGPVNYVPKYCFGFSVPEIDKIMLDRLPKNQISRLKWPQFQSKTLLGIDSAPVADLTGRLPEDIFSSIISLISVREAATTSILSKRWRNLWTTSSNLDLDPKNMLGHFLTMEHFKSQHTQWKQMQKGRFVRWANHILEIYSGKKVDSFRVEYPLGSDHGCDVDRWIQFAIDMQVQNLSINLSERHLSDLSCELYKFPYWLFDQAGKQSKIKHLSLNFCSLIIPANFNGLNSLSSLSLTKTSLSQENVDNILNGCPSLEWFSMSECRCPFHLKLSSGCRFLRLRHLRIFRCDPLEKVEIHDAISIASIEYDAKMFGQVLLKNCAQPVRICTTLDRGTLQRDGLNLQSNSRTQITYILGTLAKDYPLLETLLVYTPLVPIDIIPKHLTTFTRLKQLKLLGVSFRKILLDLTSAFLEAAPSLVELEMDLQLPCTGEEKIEHRKIVDGADYTQHKKIPLKEYCQHQLLKEVVLRGFLGHRIQFDLAVLLLKNALLLEKMRIVRETTLYSGDGECWVIHLTKDGIKQEQILKILGPEVLLKNSAQPVRICMTLDRGDRLNLQFDPRGQITYILGTVAKEYPLLETLLVITPMVQIDIIPKHLTAFTRLKQLKLLGVKFRKILLELTSVFLEAAPSLVELEMDLQLPCTNEEKIEHQKIVDGADYTEHKKIPLKEYCQHQRLKEVKLSGFRGYPIQFDLVVLLLKNALLLEKMRIVREIILFSGDGECWVLKLSKDGIKQEQILKILGPEVKHPSFHSTLKFASREEQWMIMRQKWEEVQPEGPVNCFPN